MKNIGNVEDTSSTSAENVTPLGLKDIRPRGVKWGLLGRRGSNALSGSPSERRMSKGDIDDT